MFAYDADAGKMWLGVNGTWNGSGTPLQVQTLIGQIFLRRDYHHSRVVTAAAIPSP